MGRLDQLGIKFGTDKSSLHHNYLDIYQTYIEKYRNDNIVLVDAVGGYQFPDRGGESLRMWADFLPHSKIIGIDIYEKELTVPKNVKIYKCDQTNEIGLKTIFSIEGAPTVFIDDFSHINPLTIKTFEICFPLLKPGGIYIIEDIHTFAWEEIATDGTDFKGIRGSKNLDDPIATNMLYNFCNQLILGERPDIKGIHFYKETVVILKN